MCVSVANIMIAIDVHIVDRMFFIIAFNIVDSNRINIRVRLISL